MKKTLFLAVVGAFLCGGVTYGLTANVATSTKAVEIDTSKSYDEGGYVTYTNGVLTGADLNGITFDYDYADVTEAKALIYVGVNSGDKVAYGLYTTANGGITGAWKGTTDAAIGAWTNDGTVAGTVFSGKDTGATGSITLTVGFSNGSGVVLAAGDSVDHFAANNDDKFNGSNATANTTGDLYRSYSLKSSSTDTSAVTIDSGYISKIYVTDTFEGETTYSSNGKSVVKGYGTHINATATRIELDGGANGSAATASASENPIYVGGAGQLFLQTYGHGNISLANDIYLASSTHTDVSTYGVLRLGNDDGAGYATTLTGSIVVLEDTSMGSNGTNAISIEGSVTDKKNIDGSTSEGGKTLTIWGQGYTFSGDVDVTSLVLGKSGTTKVTFEKGFTSKDLTLQAGSEITSSVAVSGLDTLTVNGAATLNADLDLNSATSLTLNAVLNLGNHTLTLGIAELSGTLITDLDSVLETEGSLTLFSGVSGLQIGTTALLNSEFTPVAAETVFTNLTAGAYMIDFADNAVKLTAAQAIPEPATATLSLLALAGLAARRRRK